MLLKPRRRGFTLLEVLLASALAVILMAALYVALDVQLRLAAAGRDAIDEATLTRAIVQRLENDLSSGIGPVAPPTGNPTAATGSATTPAAGTTTPTAEGEAIMEEITPANTMPFTAGVIGASDRLTIFISRVAGADRNRDDAGGSDIRRVTYWLTEKGLARQELPYVTADNVMASTDPIMEDGKEEASYVIAEEVTRVQFEYWDGSGWAETWDGRDTTDDGISLKGPPMAIRIRMWLTVPGASLNETIEKEVRHTIAVRGGPGPAAGTAVEPAMPE